MSKLTYYVASTMDGSIAAGNNTIEWLENFPIGDDATPYENLYRDIGAVVMGSGTYHWIMRNSSDGWPYGDLPAFILDGHSLPRDSSADITV